MSPSYPHLLATATSGLQSGHIPQGLLGAVVVWVVLMAVIKTLAALLRRS